MFTFYKYIYIYIYIYIWLALLQTLEYGFLNQETFTWEAKLQR